MKTDVLLLFLLIFPGICIAQKNDVTIYGYVSDSINGESLQDVQVVSGTYGTITNRYGFYSLRLKKGIHTLEYHYVGYKTVKKELNLSKSIKIDIDNYIFSKSEKRVMKKAQHIKSYIQKPTLTQEHLNIFEKYHKNMRDKKGWKYQETSPEHYYNSFVNGHEEFGYEVLYFDENRLIGVDLIDILEDGISSIYFYYDPDYSHFSLGKLSLLLQIKFAKKSNKKWLYLGYFVKDCPSLNYKANYKPYLTLQGRPTEESQYIWK